MTTSPWKMIGVRAQSSDATVRSSTIQVGADRNVGSEPWPDKDTL